MRIKSLFGRVAQITFWCAAALLSGRPALAADAPQSASVHIIVPVGAGGLNDALARMLAERMAAKLNRTFIVENKPGANGNIAATHVARARPDGTVLLLGSSQLAGSATLYKSLPYDLKKDLAPVALLAKTPYFLAINNDVAAQDLGQLIAQAKKNPGALSFASTGVGSGGHLLGESLQQEADVKLIHVPFHSAGQYTTELIAGRVDMVFAGLPILKPHVDSGKLRVLAVTSEERSSFLPDVPTTKEVGGPAMEDTAWFGLFAPAGTPQEIIERYGRIAREIVNEPQIVTELESRGAIAQNGNADDFSVLIDEDVAHKADIINKANVSLE